MQDARDHSQERLLVHLFLLFMSSVGDRTFKSAHGGHNSNFDFPRFAAALMLIAACYLLSAFGCISLKAPKGPFQSVLGLSLGTPSDLPNPRPFFNV